MSDRTREAAIDAIEECLDARCQLCGKTATGLATIWTAMNGDRRHCHGDDDMTPTCYERAQWGASSDEPYTIAADTGARLLKGIVP